jgi:hypothetical protein
LALGGAPAALAAAARQSVFNGIAVARTLKSAALLASVKAAFVHGMDVALVVSMGFAALGLVLALLFLPHDVLAEGPQPAPTALGGGPDERLAF